MRALCPWGVHIRVLCLVGAGPTVLVVPDFERLASLTDVSSGAVRCVSLNSVDEVGLFIRWLFVFHMY